MPLLKRPTRVFSIFFIPFLLMLGGCSSEADTVVTSDVVSTEKIAEIRANIKKLHPDADSELQTQVLDTAVRAIEDMVFIEGGKFMMGDFGMPCDTDPNRPVWRETENMCNASRWADTSPAHPVELDSYSLSKYETRVKDMDRYLLAHNQPLPKPEVRERKPDSFQFQPDNPASTRGWQDAKDYCTWLGKLSGYAIDLPTEAQWEFAARNRGQNIYYATDNGFLESPRNTDPYAEVDGREQETYPVNMMPSNPLGIYGMQSNAAEWVDDWYDPEYYSYSSPKKPKGPKKAVELELDSTGLQTYKLMRGNHTGEINGNILIRREAGVETLKKYNSYGPRDSFRCSAQSYIPLNNVGVSGN